MIGLNWSDIDGDTMHITGAAVRVIRKGTIRKDVPKTKAGIRTVNIAPVVRDLLQKHKVDQATKNFIMENAGLSRKQCSPPGKDSAWIYLPPRRNFKRF